MTIHFIRHATFIVEVNGVRLLVDPMFSDNDALDPVANCRNVKRIPMVELPLSDEQLLRELKTLDAVIITHTHRDHWDVKAQEIINKQLPLLCQPSDSETIQKQNFTNVIPIADEADFKGLKIYRTGGKHGTGEIGLKMGHVSGFVIEHKNERIYIAGDSIWCSEVEQAIQTYKPNYIVLNAGAAQFDQGDAITMTADDVIKVCEASYHAKVIAVHMDTVNHCWLKRTDLKKILKDNNLLSQCIIPADGETMMLS